MKLTARLAIFFLLFPGLAAFSLAATQANNSSLHQHSVRAQAKAATKAAKKNPPNLHQVVRPAAKPGMEPSTETPSDLLFQNYLKALPIDWDNPGQSFVSIGPYVNVPVQFNGSNLIVNDPKINTDVALLTLRKLAHQGMVAKGVQTEEETHHSHLLLSGIIETQVMYAQHGEQGANGTNSDINLAATEIDGFLLTPSPWVSGYFALSYDSTQDESISNSRILNSRVFLSNAFIILGDFTRSPYYSSMGQMFVPFGTYSTSFLTTPMTKVIAATKARALLIGYRGQKENDFYSSVYTFKGDSHASGGSLQTSRINNLGFNLGYRFSFDCGPMNVSGDFGGGWLANIADSVGMQYTGDQPQWNGFGGPTPYGSEEIVHRVPALNLRGLMSFGSHLDLIGEYVGATTSFSPNDLTFNGHAATPRALNAEAAYSLMVLDRPTAFSVGYSRSTDALALNLPQQRFGVVMNTSIWRHTIQTVELRHDTNYSTFTNATGSNVLPLIYGLGKGDTVITAKFDLYF